uniref:FH2 domain-containing protein n=1 Tax=Rhabditophanes sp. KR3021 TaxID=114890 RepID=A0AC35TUX8_9BILA
MDPETVTCKIQFVNDSDPFATTATCYLEPMRPVMFSFEIYTPIGEQIAEVIRMLRAPHKSGDASLQLYRSLENGTSDFGSYLDSEMTLAEQQDELQIIQADPFYDNSINQFIDDNKDDVVGREDRTSQNGPIKPRRSFIEKGNVTSSHIIKQIKEENNGFIQTNNKKSPITPTLLNESNNSVGGIKQADLLKPKTVNDQANATYSNMVNKCGGLSWKSAMNNGTIGTYYDKTTCQEKPTSETNHTNINSFSVKRLSNLNNVAEVKPIIPSNESNSCSVTNLYNSNNCYNGSNLNKNYNGSSSINSSNKWTAKVEENKIESIKEEQPIKGSNNLYNEANLITMSTLEIIECVEKELGLESNDNRRRSSLVVRTQTALRVKTIIDKLLHSSGGDQRRALFALKQVFQNDKDLVHEFVQSEGLMSLIRLGRNSEQSHQNYILRTLGQIMLYVDGMNGVIAHNDTIKWLYELLDSPLLIFEERREMSSYRVEWFRIVVKSALKLILIFVEYTESNALLLMAAVSTCDKANSRAPWHNLVRILREKDATDHETLIYGMTVLNKTLNGIPDQDTFFDVVDALESQNIELALKSMTALDNKEINDQISLYEKVLKQEDAANEDSDSSDGLTVRMRSSLNVNGNASNLERSSFRRQAATNVLNGNSEHETPKLNDSISKFEKQAQSLASSDWTPKPRDDIEKKTPTINNNTYSTKSYEKPEAIKVENIAPKNISDGKENIKNVPAPEPVNAQEEEVKSVHVRAPAPSFPLVFSPTESKTMDFPPVEVKKKEDSPPARPMMKIKTMDESSDGAPTNFADQLKRKANKVGDSNSELFKPKQSETEVNWKKAAEDLKSKPLIINNLDFSAFHDDEFEQDPLVLARQAQINSKPVGGGFGIPPPPPPGIRGIPPPPPKIGMNALNRGNGHESSPPNSNKTALVKLHWKEVNSETEAVPTLKNKGTFWKTVDSPQIDTAKLFKLFENKQDKPVVKKSTDEVKPQLLQCLPVKRSQVINIGLKALPKVNLIAPAIMKFDSCVLHKDMIEKILKDMMPSVTEIEIIETKVLENPDMTLGPAEEFLLSLSKIPCLLERLRLWVFMLDYNDSERDTAEHLMDLQLAMKEIEESKTFRTAMGMLLTMGNALNNTEIQGFQLDYLTKASEVKDPTLKHTLTYHLVEYMVDNYYDGTDLYSEFKSVSQTAKIDYEEVRLNLQKLEKDCKSSWDYLNVIGQKECSQSMKTTIHAHLQELAQRIHQLKAIHKLTMNRWNAFLLFFGYSVSDIPNQKPQAVCKMVYEFALEYRTTKEKILQIRKKLAEKRERNKTRGKYWMDVNEKTGAETTALRKVRPTGQGIEDRHDEMAKLLGQVSNEDTLGRRRMRPTPERTVEQRILAQREALRSTPGPSGAADANDKDDEILDGLVKAATIQSEPRDHRRKARQFNRKSLRRTRTLKLSEDQYNNY